MNEAVSQQDLAFQAALHLRQPTFFARYPRKLKLVVLSFLCILLFFVTLLTDVSKPSTPEDRKTFLEKKILSEMAYAVEDVKPDDELTYRKRHVTATHKPKTESEKSAAKANDSDALSYQMTTAPDQDLVETTSYGYLPIIAKNGRQAWQVYARPFDHQDPRPRISIVIGDMGLSRVATDAALHRMPPNVTLAFDAHSDAVGAWLERARNEGHETLLSLPMEPYDYPRSDPGPDTLLTTLPDSDNIQRLLKFLGHGVGYVGVTTMTGSRFTSDKDKLISILATLKKRGLMIFDTQISRNSVVDTLAEEMRVPVSVSSRVIDSDPTPEAIDAALISIEKTARVEGSVVALASPLPVTMDRLSLWAEELSKRGFVLAPLSAVVH